MLGDQWRPLDCVFCNNQPTKSPIYSCADGHLICASCYGVLAHQLTDSSKVQLQCKLCKAEVTNTRNLIAEMLVQNSNNPKFNSVIPEVLIPPVTSSESESSKSFSYFGTATNGRRTNEPMPSCTGTLRDTKSMLNVKSISRRPIRCPEYSCRRMVAVTSLISHFEFEHPRVLKIQLSPDAREDFVVSTEVFLESYYSLIGLLLLGEKVQRTKKNSIPISPNASRLSSKHLPIALLCSLLELPIVETDELPTAPMAIKSAPKSRERLRSSRSMSRQNTHSDAEIKSPSINSFMLVWISSLETESVAMSCSIELTDFERNILFRYHGPVNSVRDSQDPKAIFKTGKCLCVQSAVLSQLVNGEAKFLISVAIQNGNR